MTLPPKFGDAVVISAYWPGKSGGARLCTSSDLQYAAKVFRNLHFLYVGRFLEGPENGLDQFPAGVKVISLARHALPPSIGFAASLPTGLPAVAHRYSRVGVRLEKTLEHIRARAGNDPLSVIFNDIPPAVLLGRVRRQFPELPIAIRSQNLLSQAFLGIARNAGLPKRLAWGIEQRRIRAFERCVCGRANRLWAISRAEEESYRKLLGVRVHGVFGVGLDTIRYREVLFGEPRTVVHIGRLDLRKKGGMEEFLRRGWPLVRGMEPQARLLLAGKGSEEYSDAAAGVVGLGVVSDDTEFLGQGGLFVNPQSVGAGVQIKNAVALLAGKALVSTPMAAEGLDGVDGLHYVVGESPEALAGKILELMADQERARRIGRAGRNLGARTFDSQRIENLALSLLRDLASVRVHSTGREP